MVDGLTVWPTADADAVPVHPSRDNTEQAKANVLTEMKPMMRQTDLYGIWIAHANS